MQIRPATPSDAQALAAFGARTFEIAFGPYNTSQDLRDYLESHYSTEIQREEISNPGIVTLLAEEGGELVGFVQLRLDSGQASVSSHVPLELWRIYVEPDRMGDGLAQVLMEAAKNRAQRHGATALWLSVWQENPRAIAFYQKEGFRIVGEKDFWVGSDQQFDFVMQYDLS
ncbi:MAG: GNAT family N-acetyltransferase [Anaerolineales bacterium]|jgi:ribosomal protein S18 acetylase RimI-like enzyme